MPVCGVCGATAEPPSGVFTMRGGKRKFFCSISHANEWAFDNSVADPNFRPMEDKDSGRGSGTGKKLGKSGIFRSPFRRQSMTFPMSANARRSLVWGHMIASLFSGGGKRESAETREPPPLPPSGSPPSAPSAPSPPPAPPSVIEPSMADMMSHWHKTHAPLPVPDVGDPWADHTRGMHPRPSPPPPPTPIGSPPFPSGESGAGYRMLPESYRPEAKAPPPGIYHDPYKIAGGGGGETGKLADLLDKLKKVIEESNKLREQENREKKSGERYRMQDEAFTTPGVGVRMRGMQRIQPEQTRRTRARGEPNPQQMPRVR